MNRSRLIVSVTVLMLAAWAAPALAVGAAIHARGPLTDLQTGQANATDGAWVLVTAVRGGGRTTAVLNLKDLDVAAAGMILGAHVHTGPCVAGNGAAAGPHFNIDVYNGVSPAQVSAQTEVWLDFTITGGSTGHAETMVSFEVPEGAAHSIVVHALPTDPSGAAGARLACIGVDF